MQIVEICKINDSRAKSLIEANHKVGNTVYELHGRYVTVFVTDLVWKAEGSEFKSVRSGTYVFKD